VDATAEATETIAEGLRRRGQIDEEITKLETHRAGVLDELARLRASSTPRSTRTGPHRPTTASPTARRPTPSPPRRADAHSRAR
jgi:hypothetical protein